MEKKQLHSPTQPLPDPVNTLTLNSKERREKTREKRREMKKPKTQPLPHPGSAMNQLALSRD